MKLIAAEFPDFFQSIHGYSPFPWQRELAKSVASGSWPAVLDLPTASGKTAIMDVAVFALAVQAVRPTAERTACRRIAIVVDRRIVVDDAFRRAQKIRRALLDARDGVLHDVAEALRSLGGETPLEVALLRGGIYREDRWARTPAQPVILCSTVDQVGSRLLHRGYGLSGSMWPIHAGLLGNDCLIVLDEAHCSRPFLQTLGWVALLRTKAESALLGPFKALAMTATPQDDGPRFSLGADDRADTPSADPSLHPLSRRLGAAKPAKLVTAKKSKGKAVSATWITEMRGLLADSTIRTLLVVVNRVATARGIREELSRLALSRKDRLDVDSVLLTGRCRPVERDALLERWHGRIMAGRDRSAAAAEKPLVVVATQCVEVGADLDADALITEACPLDALRQRFGRLDRLGERGSSPAVIVCPPEYADMPDSSADDPIYGESLSRTWHWLKEHAQHDPVDMGIDAIDGYLPADKKTLLSPTLDAPVMFPVYCDLWVQTGPEPAVSPDPAIFLHGPKRNVADVHVVWRADLTEGREGTWADTVACLPPSVGELLPLPYHLAKRWLAGDELDDAGGDALDTPIEEAWQRQPTARPERKALRWRGPEASQAVEAEVIRPGDVLVVPCSYGGCDGEGWNPDAEVAEDVAYAAASAARRKATLRLHPSFLPTEGAELDSQVRALAELRGDEWPEDVTARVRRALDGWADVGKLAPAERRLLEALRLDKRWEVEPHPSGVGLVVRGRKRLGCTEEESCVHGDFTDEDATSGRGERTVCLAEHVEDVAARVGAMARAVGLRADLANDLVLAARLHDLGKADPRFQAWLAGGDRILGARQGLLGKSERVPMTGQALVAARRQAGYPEGGRHELLSVRLAESAPALLQEANDRDLVLHLVASHHGRCRPFAPVVIDERPIEVSLEHAGTVLRANSATGLERLDSGVAERFWCLVRRYGWWGLSYLEACIRLADHRASEDGDARKESAL